MEKYFQLANDFFKGMSGLFVTLLSFAVLAEIVFGKAVLGMDVIDNIMDVINHLGQSGLVGLITLIVLFSVMGKK